MHAGVCYLEHTQLSQETEKLAGRPVESTRGKETLAGNGTLKKIPTARLPTGSRPLEGAVGGGDITLSLAQSVPHLAETCRRSGCLTHCVGRGGGRRRRVVGTTEERKGLSPLMEWKLVLAIL